MRTGTLLATAWLVFALTMTHAGALTASNPGAKEDAGKKVFLANDCHRCHSIESHEIEATTKSKRLKGPDLSVIGQHRDAEWLEKYVEKEVQANDKDHPVSWQGSDKDLDAMVAWLATLTGTAAGAP